MGELTKVTAKCRGDYPMKYCLYQFKSSTKAFKPSNILPERITRCLLGKIYRLKIVTYYNESYCALKLTAKLLTICWQKTKSKLKMDVLCRASLQLNNCCQSLTINDSVEIIAESMRKNGGNQIN